MSSAYVIDANVVVKLFVDEELSDEARALLEGVPPHDRDRPANVATAADWIRQCRRAGLYELGRALYEKGGFSFEELGDEGQLEVEEDYQVCVRRS